MLTRGNKKGNDSELKVTMPNSNGPVNSGLFRGSDNTKTSKPVQNKGETRKYTNNNINKL